MVNKFYLYLIISLFGVLPASICSAQQIISDKTVRAQVLTIKSKPSHVEQASAAEDLYDMVKGKNLEYVHSHTIHMISDLLSNDFDGVRIWIAATLGEFGERASFAAPRLIEALKKVDCLRVDASSAFTIRTALKKMGEPVPDSACPKPATSPPRQ